MDRLITCKRCGSDACYEQQIQAEDQNVTTWMCMGCGFTSSTIMLEDSKLYNDLLETSPELYKDLLYKDDENHIWAPSTITIPGKGMVFLDGATKEDWTWTAVKATKITAEDRKVKEFPAEQEYKMDMKKKKLYGKTDFMDAMEHIGFFSVEI